MINYRVCYEATVSLVGGLRIVVNCYGDELIGEDQVRDRLKARGFEVVMVSPLYRLRPPKISRGRMSANHATIELPQHHFFTPGIGRHDEWKQINKPTESQKCDPTSI